MRDDELGVELHERQKRLRESGSNFCLLNGRPANSLWVRRVPANRNDKTRRDFILQRH